MVSPLRHRVAGSGRPAVVLLNGAGAKLGFWDKVAPGLASLTTTVAYNRALPPDYRAHLVPLGAATVAQLRALLAELDIAPPWLLVGHSMGGLYANLHARLHPQEVAGVVMVDATHPAQEIRFATAPSFSTTLFRRAIAVYDRLFGPGAMTEVVAVQAIGDEVLAAPAFPAVPLTVITAGRTPPRWVIPPRLWQMHLENQVELAALAPGGKQIVATDSDHLIPQQQPDIIIGAVSDMLARLRGGH